MPPQTPRQEHNEWIRLIDTSGPFLSVSVMMEPGIFKEGLEKRADEAEMVRRLRAAWEEWRDRPFDLYGPWVQHVLTEVLGYSADILKTSQELPASYAIRLPQYGVTLKPDFAVLDPATNKPRLLIMTVEPRTPLDRSRGGSWSASPQTRMAELLRGADVRLGLVTNGEDWTLVYAPRGETSGFATWSCEVTFLEERSALRAFYNLLDRRRFFGVAENATLEALYARSALNQQEVTDQLGLQVRHAVEILVSQLDRLDQEHGRDLLQHVGERKIYEAALTVMMRLVFLLCSEERKLFPVDDEFYADNYAVSTLRERLRTEADLHGEEILERRHDAWVRLLAIFRMVFSGVRHQRLNLPAYGGGLFDPDRFAFLEGRVAGTTWQDEPAHPLAVNNRTVLHLLESLQVIREKGIEEARRVSFRALDVEQIGHVYEGLLDHTAIRSLPGQPVLGLSGTKDQEPEIPLADLERLRAEGDHKLVAFLVAETGRSEGALRNTSTRPSSPAKRGKKAKAPARADDPFAGADEPIAWPTGDHMHEGRLLAACNGDQSLYQRVLPFAGLIRDDTFKHPVVIPGGAIYVTQGTDRRSTGTHYTPRSLTEPIVQHTLEPLVYVGPAEGLPREAWKLRTAREILDLKVCDMAMGSGAFLVEACRYLADRLIEAWEAAGSPITIPYADPATGRVSEHPLPVDPEERLVIARRCVAEQCLYGVDKNPLAVEIAKLSLWLTTLAKNRPFTFLDHALKAGDSLLGCIDIRQVENFHLDPETGKLRHWDFIGKLSGDVVTAVVREAVGHRTKLESFVVYSPRDAEEKSRLLRQADAAANGLKLIADLVCGGALRVARKECDGDYNSFVEGVLSDHVQFSLDAMTDPEERAFHNKMCVLIADASLNRSFALEAPRLNDPSDSEVFRAAVYAATRVTGAPREPFHWALEFPEVFVRKGFDAFIGNPPFQGGQKITGVLGTDYRDYLVEHIGAGRRGSADLCAYFFLRAHALLRTGGHAGLIATNTIAQGDTREVGLEAICGDGDVVPDADDDSEGTIGRDPRFINKRNWRIPPMPNGTECAAFGRITSATTSRKWPGVANLEIAEVWWRKSGQWNGGHTLNGKSVAGITPFLAVPGRALGKPHRLIANEGKSFQGSIVLGMGFVLEPEEAQALIAKDPRNRDVLFPYLNGEDLNSRPDQSPSRWVINFKDWPLERNADLKPLWRAADEKERKRFLQRGVVPSDYSESVARDFPECIEIVERLVKPERAKQNDKGGREMWWRFLRPRPELYSTIERLERVLLFAQTSKTKYPDFTMNNLVFDQKIVAICSNENSLFAVLCSHIHYHWVLVQGSSIRTDAVYTPSDCFDTFPFPASLDGLSTIGERYHEHRRQVMLARQEGLTKTYNRFHNPKETSDDIQTLRDLHVEMDRAVLDAYRQSPGEAHIWTGFDADDLEHGFHETKQGLRFTVSEPARRELLDRLLELNHKRYAEEVKAGLHDKKKGKAAAKKRAAVKPAPTPSDDLFADQESEIEVVAPTDRTQALMSLLMHLVGYRPGLAEDQYADALGDAVRIESHVGVLNGDQQDQLQELLPQVPALVFDQKKKAKVRFHDLWRSLQQLGYLRVTLKGATRHFEPTGRELKKDHGWLVWPVEDFAELVLTVGESVDRERDGVDGNLAGRDLEGVEV